MKQLLLVFAILCSTTIFLSNATATQLTLETLPSVINPGESTFVKLIVSGLNIGGPDSLGAFDIAVTYDDNILDFEFVSFTDWLGNPYGSNSTAIIFEDDTIPGELRLLGTSFLFDWELDALQTVDNMILAVMAFKGVLPGTSALGFGNVDLSDAFGWVLDPVDLERSSVFVTPEPSTYLLFISGLAGLIFLRRRKDKVPEFRAPHKL